jgi:histidinol-phosphate phosphatase family protein
MTDTGAGGQVPRVSLVRTGEHTEVLRETRAAVFLDRDGTIIDDSGYVRRPDDVKLIAGAAMAIRLAHNVNRPVIVVTNQSGIARGLLTEADYRAVHQRMEQLLAEYGAFLDAEYACPHHPDVTGPCDCRKPGLALYERAARDHGLDLAASAYIGDRWRAGAPGGHYGGVAILVPGPATPPDEVEQARMHARVVATLRDAITLALDGQQA